MQRLSQSFLVLWLGALLMLASVASTYGQGVLIDTASMHPPRLPRPPIWPEPPHPRPRPVPQATYKISQIGIDARLTDQVARVQVLQTFVNTGSATLQASFVFPLPYDGAIDQLTLLVDGQEFEGKLLDKDEARRRYEEIVRGNRDPALLQWIGTGMYQTSVFPIPPGAKREVTLRYTQLCPASHGLTDFTFPLATARYTSQPVDELRLRVVIESASEIKNLYSPTHAVNIERPDKQRATVSYTGKKQVPTSDFRLFYDVGREAVGASVLSFFPEGDDQGYFLLLATPEIKAAEEEAIRKAVVLVLDRSGSMSGKKIAQARQAAKFVLNNLRQGDLFNVIAYDSEIEQFRPELQRYDDTTRQAALGFVESVYAGGSTNIDGALATALGQLKDPQLPSYVLFLTDGLPTSGETGEMQIVANARQRNEVRARIIAFGVGYDLNSRLLDKLARENHGQTEFVRPDEDIEAHVSRLYDKIRSPVMVDVKLEIDLDVADAAGSVNRVYPQSVTDLFAGQQLTLVGRYKHPGEAKVRLRGTVGGQEQSFEFPATLAAQSADSSRAFVAKIWAARRIGQIIDELDLKGKNQELIDELVALSKRHGILTPYTSFLADETMRSRNPEELARMATDASSTLLQQAEGRSGVSQRAAKESLRNQAVPSAAMAPGDQGGFGGNFYRDAQSDRNVEVHTVRQIGERTFYRNAGRWVDADVDESAIERAQHVAQLSETYNRLLAEQPAANRVYLTLDEPVVIRLGEQLYLIEPPQE